MNVTGSWWCIEDKVIKVAPVGIGNELLESRGSHTTTPKGGSVWINKETDREEFHTILLDRFYELSTILLDTVRTLVFNTKHLWHTRSEDISIEQTNLIPKTCQCNSEIGRDSALPYSTLTRTYSNDVLHLR